MLSAKTFLVQSDGQTECRQLACIRGDIAPNLAFILGPQIQRHGVAGFCNVLVELAQYAPGLTLQRSTHLHRRRLQAMSGDCHKTWHKAMHSGEKPGIDQIQKGSLLNASPRILVAWSKAQRFQHEIR